MDDIWVIVGTIVLMVLSSLSSVKKRKGSTSSVDMEEEQEGAMAMDDEASIPIDEPTGYDYNKQPQGKFDEYFSYENEMLKKRTSTTLNYIQEKEENKETNIIIEDEPEDEIETCLKNEVDFDLRKAVIYSTIIDNPYIETEKNR